VSYAPEVTPNAAAAIRALDVEAQEVIFDLVDRLALEGSNLQPAEQIHQVWVMGVGSLIFVALRLDVDHARRRVVVARVLWLKRHA
jgi:hypothetical protein